MDLVLTVTVGKKKSPLLWSEEGKRTIVERCQSIHLLRRHTLRRSYLIRAQLTWSKENSQLQSPLGTLSYQRKGELRCSAVASSLGHQLTKRARPSCGNTDSSTPLRPHQHSQRPTDNTQLLTFEDHSKTQGTLADTRLWGDRAIAQSESDVLG